ncbi:hypothetical protein AAEO57_15365 [Flavobacterium sp. DGU38]|uniref:Uncharacterized protein n=1 Tax=Flavobacterium calami TaxID=3139144 RepID=A0ABU9IRT2_9FLAO
MLKKTIFIENKFSLTTKYNQLVLKSETKESTIPIEDIGFLVLDHNWTFFIIIEKLILASYPFFT